MDGCVDTLRRQLDDTLAHAERAGLTTHLLPPGFDIDTVEDLEEVLAAANSPRWSFLIERGGRAITIRIVYRS